MNTKSGKLLIAAPHLLDDNFVRAVVLLLQHTEEGALGLILNRPTATPLKGAWETVSDTPCDIETPLYFGGPCQGPLMVLHTQAPFATAKAIPGVFFTGESEHVESLIARQEDPLRFYVGYAGWGPGQLEDELAEGSWKLASATEEHVFGDQSELWQQLVREASADALVSMLNIRNVPDDPSMN